MWYFGLFFLLGVGWAMIQSWRGQAQTETIQPWKTFIHLMVFNLSYLLFLLYFFVIYNFIQGTFNLISTTLLLFLLSILIHARFIEPQMLKVAIHKKKFLSSGQKGFKVALISDLHIGIFTGSQKQLRKIIQKLNELNPDIVIMAGDWTYEPKANLSEQLKVFKQLKMPIYSVLGNHDEGFPGPPILQQLRQALNDNNIIDIEKQIIDLESFYLAGVGDLWAGKADLQALQCYPQLKPLLIVSHNPDTAEMVPPLKNKALMLSGHTHGGQVKLPWFTQYYLKKVSHCGHNRGWYRHKNTELFVTVGTGMVGIPFRFRTPPTIDLIELIADD